MTSNTITILLDQLRYGGAERALVYLARGFSNQGFSVDFLIRNRRFGAYLADLPPAVNLHEIEKAHPVSLRWYMARRLPQLVRAAPELILGYRSLPMAMRLLPGLASYLNARQPLALLTTLPQNNLLALWAREAAKTNTRIIIREANCFSLARDMSKPGSKSALLRLAKDWYPAADGIVAVCDGVATDLAQSLDLPRERIQTIHNPVDLHRVAELSQQDCPHPWLEDRSQPVLVTVGRLTQQKDHKTLLRALHRVNQHRPVRLIIVGDGGLKEKLQAEATRLGVHKQVHWAGTTDNPYAYMARASAFVLTSAWEGLPNVLLEAFACRIPVVSTDAAGGGPAELLQHGRHGQLVAVGDIVELADAIQRSLQYPRSIEHAFSYVQGFSLERSARQYLSVMLS